VLQVPLEVVLEGDLGGRLVDVQVAADVLDEGPLRRDLVPREEGPQVAHLVNHALDVPEGQVAVLLLVQEPEG
jgi:hypothetical protein